MRPALLKLAATALTLGATVASALYVPAHLKNPAAPLQPGVLTARDGASSSVLGGTVVGPARRFACAGVTAGLDRARGLDRRGAAVPCELRHAGDRPWRAFAGPDGGADGRRVPEAAHAQGRVVVGASSDVCGVRAHLFALGVERDGFQRPCGVGDH